MGVVDLIERDLDAFGKAAPQVKRDIRGMVEMGKIKHGRPLNPTDKRDWGQGCYQDVLSAVTKAKCYVIQNGAANPIGGRAYHNLLKALIDIAEEIGEAKAQD